MSEKAKTVSLDITDTISPIGFVYSSAGNTGGNRQIYSETLFDMLLGTPKNSTYTENDINIAIVPIEYSQYMKKAETYSPIDIVGYIESLFTDDTGYKPCFIKVLPAIVAMNSVYILSMFYVVRHIRQTKSKKDAIEFIFTLLEYNPDLDIFDHNINFNKKLFILENIEEIKKDEVAAAAWPFIADSILEKKTDCHNKHTFSKNTINDMIVPAENIKSNFTFGSIDYLRYCLCNTSESLADVSYLVKMYQDVDIPSDTSGYSFIGHIRKMSDTINLFNQAEEDSKNIAKIKGRSDTLRAIDVGVLDLSYLRSSVYNITATSTFSTVALRSPVIYDSMAYQYGTNADNEKGRLTQTKGIPTPYLANAINISVAEEERLRSSIKDTFAHAAATIAGTAVMGYVIPSTAIFAQAMIITTIALTAAQITYMKEQLVKLDKYNDDILKANTYKPFSLLDNYAKLPYLNRVCTDAILSSTLVMADFCNCANVDITRLHELPNTMEIESTRDCNYKGKIDFSKVYTEIVGDVLSYYVNRNRCIPVDLRSKGYDAGGYVIERINENNKNFVFRNPNETYYKREVTENAVLFRENYVCDINDPSNIMVLFNTSTDVRSVMEALIDIALEKIKNSDNFLTQKYEEYLAHMRVNLDVMEMMLAKACETDIMLVDNVGYKRVESGSYGLRKTANEVMSALAIGQRMSLSSAVSKVINGIAKVIGVDTTVDNFDLVFKRWYCCLADYHMYSGGKLIDRFATYTSPRYDNVTYYTYLDGGPTITGNEVNGKEVTSNHTLYAGKEIQIESTRPKYLKRIIDKYSPSMYCNINNMGTTHIDGIEDLNSSGSDDPYRYLFTDGENTKNTFTGLIYEKLVNTNYRYNVYRKNEKTGKYITDIDLNKILIQHDDNSIKYKAKRGLGTIINEEVMDYLDLGIDVKVINTAGKNYAYFEFSNEIKNLFLKPIVISFAKYATDKANVRDAWNAYIEDTTDEGFDKTLNDVFTSLPANSKYIYYKTPLTNVIKVFCYESLGKHYNYEIGKLDANYNPLNSFNIGSDKYTGEMNGYTLENFISLPFITQYATTDVGGNKQANGYHKNDYCKIIMDIRKHNFVKNIFLGIRSVYFDLIHRDCFNLAINTFLTSDENSDGNDGTTTNLIYPDYSVFNRNVDNTDINTFTFIKTFLNKYSAITTFNNYFTNLQKLFVGTSMYTSIAGGTTQ